MTTRTLSACRTVPRPAETVRRLGQQVRPLRDAPGDDEAGHGEDGQHPRAAGGVAGQQHQRAEPHSDADDDDGSARDGHAVEDVRGVGVQDDQPDRADDGDDDGR